MFDHLNFDLTEKTAAPQDTTTDLYSQDCGEKCIAGNVAIQTNRNDQHSQKRVFSDISTPTENDPFFILFSATYRSSVRAQGLGRTPAFADPDIQ